MPGLQFVSMVISFKPATLWVFVMLLAAFSLGAPTVALANEAVEQLAGRLFSQSAEAIQVGSLRPARPWRRVNKNGRAIGFLASTWAVTGTVGYSGKPVDILLAIGVDGKIKGAELLNQSEPILTIGISEADIARFVDKFAGFSVQENAGIADPTTIAGATVSSGVIRDGIVRTLRAVTLMEGLIGGSTVRQIDRSTYEAANWDALVKLGGLSTRKILVGEAREALGQDLLKVSDVKDEALFSQIWVSLLSPPLIGQNLLGQQLFTTLTARAGAEDALIFVAGIGLHSFKGTGWRRSGRFERLEIRQGSLTIQPTRAMYSNVEKLAAKGAPEFREMGVFTVQANSGFNSAIPFRISVLATHETAAGAAHLANFEVAYRLPEKLILGAAEAGKLESGPAPLWKANWRARAPSIAIVCIILAALTVILVFQDALARRYVLYRRVRIGFLAVTFTILGLALGAQLSVVHVLTFAQAIRTGFRWETFLLDPLVFILWSFVAAALLFWGRGVFCGWLCPFGALQELINEAAQKLRIKQINVPFALHERMWPIKYVIFLALFALSLDSIKQAFALAEIEPFKTAITLKFIRAWPFVLFVFLLLTAGLFIERFYCRYLCPLGAALAIPARLRMFEWLKRRHQCGKECRICATRCTVQAIHPDGRINPNECIHCLNCQTLYFDQTTCPPLKARARRRAAAAAKRKSA